MYVVGIVVIAAMGAGLIYQDRKIQKYKAQRRILRAKYKEAQLLIGQHDRVSLKEVENLRRAWRAESSRASRESKLKHAYRRNCEAMKAQMDDQLDKIDSLRLELDSANGTIRELMDSLPPLKIREEGEPGVAFEIATASSGRLT